MAANDAQVAPTDSPVVFQLLAVTGRSDGDGQQGRGSCSELILSVVRLETDSPRVMRGCRGRRREEAALYLWFAEMMFVAFCDRN